MLRLRSSLDERMAAPVAAWTTTFTRSGFYDGVRRRGAHGCPARAALDRRPPVAGGDRRAAERAAITSDVLRGRHRGGLRDSTLTASPCGRGKGGDPC